MLEQEKCFTQEKLIGHTLKDFTTYGSAWWSWIICSGIIGIIFGFAGRKMDLQHGEFTTNDMVRFNIFQAFGNIVVSNIVAVGIIGTLLMKAYASTRTKKGSLSKD